MQFFFAVKCLHNLDSTLKAKSILKIGFLDQPISAHPMQLTTQKESHIKNCLSFSLVWFIL